MATIVLKNLTSSEIYLRDVGAVIGKSGVTDSAVGRIETITLTRPAAEVNMWAGVAAEVAAGNLTMSVTLSADEIASGMGTDLGAVASTDLLSEMVVIRKSCAAGGGGSADDVTIYAAGKVPTKMRVLDVLFVCSAGNAGGRTVTLRTATGGVGTALSDDLDCTATGVKRLGAVTSLGTVATTDALVVRRSDSAVAGEIVVIARREV